MLNNVSAAAVPTNVGNSGVRAIVMFGPHSTSQTSATFNVDQFPFFISVFNLTNNDDVINIQQVSPDGTEVADYAPVFGPTQLTNKRTKIRIDHPGVYQLVHTGSTALGQFTVTGFAAVMAVDTLTDLAQALALVIASNQISGTLPIRVTGTGPFVISEDAASNGDMEIGTSTIVGVTPATLSHIVGANGSTGPHHNNTYLGVGTGSPVTISTETVFIGHGAGPGDVNDHTGSVCIGNNAKDSALSDWLDVVLIGNNAAQAGVLTTGSVMIGAEAGALCSAIGGVNIGYQVKNSATEAEGVTIGFQAGAGSNATDVCIGTQAGQNMHGPDSISIGSASNFNVGDADFAVAVGVSTKAHLHCVAVGGNAIAGGTGATGVTGGVAIGYNAAALHENMVSIGTGAGQTATNSANLFIGDNAGNACTGARNTFIGTGGIGATASGGANVVIGSVLVPLGAGGSNVYIGDRVGVNGGASDNVFIGDNVAQGVTGAGASSSVYIGSGAAASFNFSEASTVVGFGAASSGSGYGTYIGNGAGATDTHTNVLIINQGTAGLVATANNQAVLGDNTITTLITAGSSISGGVIGPSDERLKESIFDLENGLGIIESLDPVTFRWDEKALETNSVPHIKEDVAKLQYGLIAQDVYKVLPEVVQQREDGFMFLHYDRLIPILISAVKELSAELAEIKTRIK
jgi:hypothetical protein